MIPNKKNLNHKSNLLLDKIVKKPCFIHYIFHPTKQYYGKPSNRDLTQIGKNLNNSNEFEYSRIFNSIQIDF